MAAASRRRAVAGPPDPIDDVGTDLSASDVPPSPSSPVSLDSLEVVERMPAGRGFSRADHIDSFAMDDPPSEEVRLDPRFHRFAEPATELIDREALRELADSSAEDMLAGPPPHPDEVTRQSFDLDGLAPM